MSLINFESSREKEKKRQWEREARNAILEKAKNKYESEKQEEETRRQRGEHTWMLQSVESKLDSAKEEKKKKKKEKKKKKKSKKKKDNSSSSSSESDEENETWVEKQGPQTSKDHRSASGEQTQEASSTASKRDGWMEMTSLFKTYSRNEIREQDGSSRKKEKEEEKKRREEANKPGSHARELNPYYKDGGTGLPEENKDPASMASSSPSIGLDASWLRKALQRAKEQAQLEKVPLEEIAARRWGSLEKFNELLAQAEGRGRNEDRWKNKQSHHSSSHRSREESRSKSRERKRSGSRERREKRWSRDRNRSTSRDRRRSKSRERKRNRSSERQTYKSRDDHTRSERSKEMDVDPNDRRRDEDKRRGRRDRRRYSSSSSSSSSERHDDKTDTNQKEQHSLDSRQRISSNVMKLPSDEPASRKSSLLSSKFHKPGENIDTRKYGPGMANKGGTSSNQRWQKKDPMKNEERKKQSKIKSESSSSSSSEAEESDQGSMAVEETRKTVSSSSPSNKETPLEKPVVMLTDKEMNDLAAKILKAELVGNDTLANKLKNKLETARTARLNAPTDSGSGEGHNKEGEKEEVVILTRTDARGFSRPVSVSDPSEGKKKQGKTVTHGKDGKRNKYFPDDDKYSLKQMFEAEKTTTAEDQNSMFSRAAMKNHEKLNEDYDMDDMFMSKAALKESSAKQAERDRKRAIEEHHRSERSLESCQWCFDNKEMAKHLIVALGTKAYVCLPSHESLTQGHCLIVPIHHVMSSVHADEDLWGEIMSFRKSLVKMFNSREEDCIFFETVKKLRYFPHMTVHCVPLPKEIGDMAPIYFKKAIMECEAEWAQNKKLVELKNRDVRKAVPKGLPYFFVDFAMDPGYAHVIEDEQTFPTNFAQEIVGGMLDLETNIWRKPRKENFDAQRRKVMEFSRWYKDFDITQETRD